MEASIETQNNKVMSLEVVRAKNGDKNSFCNLIRENKLSMYRVAKSILGKEEDVEDFRRKIQEIINSIGG